MNLTRRTISFRAGLSPARSFPGRGRPGSEFQAAFTLIELMLAIVVLSLLASAAALSFNRPIQAARAQDSIELVRSFDEGARQVARRFNRPVVLRFDLQSAELSRIEDGQTTYQSKLPPGCRIREVRTAARRTVDGDVQVPCSALGATRTYAVHLTGTGFDRWLLVSGLSGEVTAIHDEAQLDAIFTTTAARNESRPVGDAPGNDAD